MKKIIILTIGLLALTFSFADKFTEKEINELYLLKCSKVTSKDGVVRHEVLLIDSVYFHKYAFMISDTALKGVGVMDFVKDSLMNTKRFVPKTKSIVIESDTASVGKKLGDI